MSTKNAKIIERLKRELEKIQLENAEGEVLNEDTVIIDIGGNAVFEGEKITTFRMQMTLAECRISYDDQLLVLPAFAVCEIFNVFEEAHEAWHSQIQKLIERVIKQEVLGRVFSQIGHAHITEMTPHGEA